MTEVLITFIDTDTGEEVTVTKHALNPAGARRILSREVAWESTVRVVIPSLNVEQEGDFQFTRRAA